MPLRTRTQAQRGVGAPYFLTQHDGCSGDHRLLPGRAFSGGGGSGKAPVFRHPTTWARRVAKAWLGWPARAGSAPWAGRPAAEPPLLGEIGRLQAPSAGPDLSTLAPSTGARSPRETCRGAGLSGTGRTRQAGHRGPSTAGRTRQAGRDRPGTAGRAPQAGHRRPGTAGRAPQAGHRRPDAAGGAPQAGRGRPGTAGRTRQAGHRRPDATGRAPQAGRGRPGTAGRTRQAGHRRLGLRHGPQARRHARVRRPEGSQDADSTRRRSCSGPERRSPGSGGLGGTPAAQWSARGRISVSPGET
jgi:hypothetical protein